MAESKEKVRSALNRATRGIRVAAVFLAVLIYAHSAKPVHGAKLERSQHLKHPLKFGPNLFRSSSARYSPARKLGVSACNEDVVVVLPEDHL